MKNAYNESIIKGRPAVISADHESKGEAKVEVVELRCGERKRRVEMADHAKRGGLLKRFGISTVSENDMTSNQVGYDDAPSCISYDKTFYHLYIVAAHQ